MSARKPPPDRLPDLPLPTPDITAAESEHLPEDRPLDDVEHALLGAATSSGNPFPIHSTPVGPEAQFIVEPGARMRCSHCGSSINAQYLPANTIARVERASDPADNLMVVPLECPVCGAVGTFTAHVGAEATKDEADVLKAMPRDVAIGV